MKSFHVEAVVKGSAAGQIERIEAGYVADIPSANRVFSQIIDARADHILITVEGCSCSDEAVHEMVEVQDAFDQHAFVSARCVSSAIADAGLLEKMPASNLTFPAPRVCLLMRTKDVLMYGKLDESCSSVNAALVEFMLRLSLFGQSCLVANRAFVDTSALTDEEARELCDVDTLHAELDGRYPALANRAILSEGAWLDELIPLAIRPDRARPRILFDFFDMDAQFNGTVEYQIALLEYFVGSFMDRFEVIVRANEGAIAFHNLRNRFGDIFYGDDEVPLCDLGIVAAQPTKLEQQLFLNAHCVRIVYTMLDCIMLRVGYLADTYPGRADVVRSGIHYADGIVAISNFSHEDYLNFYSSESRVADIPECTVYISSESDKNKITPKDVEALPFDEYVLVAGNPFRHKALSETLRAVADTGRNYVIMGIGFPCDWEEGTPLPSNVVCYAGGVLSEGFLACLYEHASCVVFPSQYEGFGLPITIAWRHRKKAIVYDYALNRELQDYFSDMRDNIVFFSSLDEVPGLVDDVVSGAGFTGDFDMTWEPAITQIAQFVENLIAEPIDWARIDERQWFYRSIVDARERGHREGVDEVGFKRLFGARYLVGHPVRERVLRGAAHAVKRILPKR